MKISMNIDLTPQEARAFFGLPDVEPINERLVAEVLKRTEANMELLDPTEMMRAWTSMGGAWADQFFEVMRSAATQTTKKD